MVKILMFNLRLVCTYKNKRKKRYSLNSCTHYSTTETVENPDWDTTAINETTNRYESDLLTETEGEED